jgi:phage-related minor tail protein
MMSKTKTDPVLTRIVALEKRVKALEATLLRVEAASNQASSSATAALYVANKK